MPRKDGNDLNKQNADHKHVGTDAPLRGDRLYKSEERLKLIFENSVDVIYLSTKEGLFTDINPAGIAFFGYSRQELMEMNIINLYHNPNNRKFFQAEIRKNGYVKDLELTLRRKDSTTVDSLLTATALKDDNGKIFGYQGVIRDITEKKKLEAQLRQAVKMESVGRLAGGIAHDFNNLLTIINGYAETLLLELEMGKEKLNLEHSLRQILKAGEKSAALVSKILAFSRKQVAEPVLLKVNEVIRELETMVKRIIGEDIQLVLNLSEDISDIFFDPSQLEQILLNLIVNARDAMPGGGTLTIETFDCQLDSTFTQIHPGSKTGNYVEMTLTDTGSGMEKAVLEKIFEPFFTTKKKGEGTGLGMATVYGIVKQNGGFISAYSEPGKGSIFRVYFPRRLSAGERPTAEPFDKEISDFAGQTVLIVEDEYGVRKLAEKIFALAGFHVLVAGSGEEAYRLAESFHMPINLLFTDVIMTGITGPETAERVKKLHPECRVLFASGYPETHLRRLGVGKGTIFFLKKPYSKKQLMQKVNEVLE